MKKSIFTLSLVALFTIAGNAQAVKTKDAVPAQTTVNSDGTVTETKAQPTSTATAAKKEETPVKKSGTRMAINEKGLPGGSAKTTTKKETEKTSSAPGQPGTSGKKD